MGVVYKLKPDVLSFIKENKQNNPALSCRHLTSLILEQLHIKVSKSSINAIFKQNNLSMPVGRRRKLKKKKFNLPVLPVIESVKVDRLDDLSGKIIQDQGKEKIAEEKTAQELARIKAFEEARLLELERLAQEAAENKRKQEEARKIEEEKSAQELAKIKALEEAKLRELERLAQEAAENKQREEVEVAQELAKIKAFEEARLLELERLAQEAAKNKQREEEKAAQELAKIKALEEAKLLELERLAQEAAENKRKQEEARKPEEEKAVQEAELKAEKERWARLAEEEQKARQQANKEGLLPKVELVALEILPEDRVCSGAIILKALDCLIGGSKEINAAISRAIGGRPEDSLNLTETVIFKSLFSKGNVSTLGDMIGVQYSQEKLSNYYAQIKQITDIGFDTAKIISNVFTEAKGVKAHFIDGSVIHLDGQLHSSWPGTRFSYDFSNTVLDLKNNLNKYFLQGAPLVLFSPPGYDILPKDFFNLLLNIGSEDNYPDNLTLFGNQLEELDNLTLNPEHRCVLVFGLWPWQFTSCRKVKKIGDFYLKHIKEIDRDLYLGEIEIDLFRASSSQSISLKGCAVKTDLKEKIRLVILHSAKQAMGLDELAGIYLGRWPNFEEGFQDFSRKIELSTYAGTEQKFFSKDSFGMDTAGLTKELGGIFVIYIKMLDAYLRWHFLPTEYKEKDLFATDDCFYKIPVKLMASQSRIKARTLVSQNYQYLKDLEYLNCRLNERQINAANGKIFWFESAFK